MSIIDHGLDKALEKLKEDHQAELQSLSNRCAAIVIFLFAAVLFLGFLVRYKSAEVEIIHKAVEESIIRNVRVGQ